MTSKGVPGATVGHGHLKVADLERAVTFYRDVIGMKEVLRHRDQAAFLSFDDYHHHLGLNTWDSAGGTPPDRSSLGQVIDRIYDAGYALTGAADHLVSEAVYLNDPDGNGVELYRDRPKAEWPHDGNGVLQMSNAPLDVAALVAEGRAAA